MPTAIAQLLAERKALDCYDELSERRFCKKLCKLPAETRAQYIWYLTTGFDGLQ